MGNGLQNNEDNNVKQANNYIKYSGLAFQMIAIIGLMAYIGYRIDDSASHVTKWVTAIFALSGVLISLLLVIRSVKS